MMNDMEEPDSSVVAVKPTNEGTPPPRRSRWSKESRPRGIREAIARAGHRAGKACLKRPTGYGDCRAAEQ